MQLLNTPLYYFSNICSFLCIKGGTPGVSHAETSKIKVESKVYTLENFVHQAEIDHLNMFTLVDFFKRSKIGQKVIYLKYLNVLLYIYVKMY